MKERGVFLFGYIRASKGDLKVKEYEFYKAVYCSLCKTMGREYSPLSRFTLSYDFTFLALLNIALKDGCDAVERKHCVFNPLKKCIFCKNNDTHQDKCTCQHMIFIIVPEVVPFFLFIIVNLWFFHVSFVLFFKISIKRNFTTFLLQ